MFNYNRNSETSNKVRKSTSETNNIEPTNKNKQVEEKDKRELLAKAALARQANWRQGGSSVTSNDHIIAKITSIYRSQNKEAPIGLYVSSPSILKQHYHQLVKSNEFNN